MPVLPLDILLAPFETWFDVFAFVTYVLVFPVYHAVYPRISRRMPGKTALGRTDRYRRSWIKRVIETGDIITAVQQTRNLAMVNSLLASAALILLGFTANNLFRVDEVAEILQSSPNGIGGKLGLLLLTLGVAFSFFAMALRNIGHFNLAIGADPALIEEDEGSAVDFLTKLIARASNRSTLGIRTFYSAFPVFLWIFSPWFFFAATALWAIPVHRLPGLPHGTAQVMRDRFTVSGVLGQAFSIWTKNLGMLVGLFLIMILLGLMGMGVGMVSAIFAEISEFAGTLAEFAVTLLMGALGATVVTVGYSDLVRVKEGTGVDELLQVFE